MKDSKQHSPQPKKQGMSLPNKPLQSRARKAAQLLVEGLHKAFKSGLESEPYVGVMAKMLFQIPYLGPKDTMETWKRDYEILGRLLKK